MVRLRFSPLVRRFVSLAAAIALAGVAGAPLRAAIGSPDQHKLSLQELDELRKTGVPDGQWPALIETLGQEDLRAAVTSLIKELQPFPAAKLVGLLSSPKLAVRLGALDLLEDAAGETFGFDPWLASPEEGGNAEALKRWQAWSAKGAGEAPVTAAVLNEETFRVIALEIMSGDRERAERGVTRLNAYGLAAVAHIEAFFASQPGLDEASRSALKGAEYRVVLAQVLPKQAAGLARDLSLGRPEIQSAALARVGKGGPGALPVIADFLVSPDPLVRESAADAAFEGGKAHAVGLGVERLREEKAESVLHALLRGVGQYAADQAQNDAIAKLTEHPAENVVISAIEALGANQKGDVAQILVARLADARWRVRAAALESIGKRNLKNLNPKIEEQLGDADLFVRVTAVNTLQKVAADGAVTRLVHEFERQDDLKAPIIQALFTIRQKRPLPDAVWPALEKAPPEIILQCLDAFEDRSDYDGSRVPNAARFATYPNADVASSALRLLAGRGLHTGLLLGALRSTDAARQDAVLDEMRLRPGTLSGPAPGGEEVKAAPNPLLNRLYDSLLGAAKKPAAVAPASATPPATQADASPTELRAVLDGFFRQKESPRRQFRAAVILTGQGDGEATQWLLTHYDTLSNTDRGTVAGAMASVTDWSGPALELALRLLRDPEDDVREKAIETWIDTGKPERLAAILAEFARSETRLSPDDLYGWELDRLAQAAVARPAILDWGKAVLADERARVSAKVLAVVLLSRSGQAQQAPIEPLLDSPEPWLRRAAYRALGLAAAQSRLEKLLGDEAALVRAALPFVAAPQSSAWQHWFDDAHHARDSEDFDDRSRFSGFGAWAQRGKSSSTVTPEVLAALDKLTRDPSELVRFETLFALLRLGQSVDPVAFGALVAAQTEDSYARRRLGNFLQSSYGRLGRGYGVLVPLASDISESDMPKILRHFGIENEKAYTSFAALSQFAPSAVQPADLSVAAAPATSPAQAAAASTFRVLFFYKQGCRECDRVREMLNVHAAQFPAMILEERNIDDPREAVLNEALSARFQLKDTLHQVTPAIFSQGGTLVKGDITFPRLGELLRKTADIPADPEWARVASTETVAAEQTIATRFDALSFGVVAVAGLLDGINPCAFATIIFLLSYLQVARRNPGEILAVGAAFILAVFLSYLLVGLGLAQVLTRISGLRVAGMVLNYVLAGFALVVALLSFRDAQLAARGQYGEMTLQLPGLLKEQIRGVIRTGARASRFIVAAFAAGVVISLLELACTGQVYLPTILYMLRSGNSGAMRHLLLYNVAFVTPLIVIFALAWTGMRSDALVRFQKNHTALVKVLTGVLFLLLTAFLLFGHTFIPQMAAGQ